jgi:hypothetical protein
LDSSTGSPSDTPFARLTSTLLFFALLVLLCASGCATTVLVPDGSPMRSAKLRGTVLQRIDGQWVESSEVEIPEGWYLVPPRFVE